MKKILCLLTIFLLSQEIFSCEEQGKDDEANAECCAKKNSPDWCPSARPSKRMIRSKLKKLSRSSKARSFRKREMGKSTKSLSSSPRSMSRHFWPSYCPWYRYCCRKCYFWYIVFGHGDWWGYMQCIWWNCWW